MEAAVVVSTGKQLKKKGFKCWLFFFPGYILCAPTRHVTSEEEEEEEEEDKVKSIP